MARNERHREQIRAMNRAVYRAERELIRRHRAEFDVLYQEEAEREGVTPAGRRTAPVLATEEERLARRRESQATYRARRLAAVQDDPEALAAYRAEHAERQRERRVRRQQRQQQEQQRDEDAG